MNYQESLDWIHGKLKFGSKPGLERISWLLQELGNPQEKIRGVHVVGTNGKGSTVNYLQKIFTGSGYDVGTFVSPFIVDFRERISLNGQMIDKETFVSLVEKIEPIVERLPKETSWTPATEFEIITALMFLYFGDVRPVDIVFVEAGLGGLYDSTNVFSPIAVICPSIGLDHQDILGQTYEAIARQKAGVLKNAAPFIYAVEREEVRNVFQETAALYHAPTYELGKDFKYQDKGDSFDFSFGQEKRSNLRLTMPGKHQKNNASLALMATELLKKDYPQLSDTAIRQALADSQWVGRTEFLRPNLMIDGAHNQESVQMLVDVLKADYTGKEIHILFAAINTKPVDEMLTLLDEFTSLTVTSFDYPTSLQLEDYPAAYAQITNWQEWIERFATVDDNSLYVVTGSLYFISQVRKFLAN
ncbi:bifunctional folylpolyglutamate synthase/dihydrofolate synthase [Streptococcus cameli]